MELVCSNQNIDKFIADYTRSQPRTRQSAYLTIVRLKYLDPREVVEVSWGTLHNGSRILLQIIPALRRASDQTTRFQVGVYVGNGSCVQQLPLTQLAIETFATRQTICV